MLTITVPAAEFFDESRGDGGEFVTFPEVTLELEHSLVALSKWESKFEKPFLGNDSQTPEETIGYVKAMVVTPNVPPDVFDRLTVDNLKAINEYLALRMTATTIREMPGTPASREIITSELIYYWMGAFQIDIECENWHLNRLFTLIKIYSAKNSPAKKMSKAEAIAQHRAINEQNRKLLNTRG